MLIVFTICIVMCAGEGGEEAGRQLEKMDEKEEGEEREGWEGGKKRGREVSLSLHTYIN